MNAALLLAEAAAAGVHLEARIWADRLDWLPPELRGKLRDHQAELLAALVLQAGGGGTDAQICASVPVVADVAPPIEQPIDDGPVIYKAMPVSWSDSRIPVKGNWCRNCQGKHWWGDAKGWCCARCHPPIPGNEYEERYT